MLPTIQAQPKKGSGPTEKTTLLKSATQTSLASSIRSVGSLSELDAISEITTFRINRHNKRLCFNFSRNYQVRDGEGNELLFTAFQENGLCSCANDDYEDMVIYDLHDKILFAIEFEEITGYLSKQMKFSVVSSARKGLGSVSKLWHFMASPRFEILSWSGELLFSIGPPITSGIRSYNFTLKYDIISSDGRVVAKVIQEQKGRSVALKFNQSEVLSIRDKTLILSFGFILDLLRYDES